MSIKTVTNINPLPIYNTIGEQLHRQSYGEKKPILTQNNKLLPFQIITDMTTTSVLLEVYDLNNNLIKTIDNTEAGVFNDTVYATYRIWFTAGYEFSVNLPSNVMYFKYSFTDLVSNFEMYSEIFQTVTDTTPTVQLEWWNDAPIPLGDYSILDDYTILVSGHSVGRYAPFRCFFNSNIGLPQYPFTKIVEDRESTEFQIAIIRDKTFKFGMWVTEAEYDAITICALADYIAITHKNKLYKVESIDFKDPEWNDKGGVGWVDITFKVGDIVKKTSPAKPTRGDFNDDYSTDF